MAENTDRRLKLQPEERKTSYANRQKVVPSLKLCGVWMEELGFKPGDIVNVTTRERLLIIEPAKEQEEMRRVWEKRLGALKNELNELKQWASKK